MNKDFHLFNVDVESQGQQVGRWQFAGRNIKGTIFEYLVTDHNFQTDRKWRFAVRVPNDFRSAGYIEVRALHNPQKRCWSGIERMSVNFARATRPNYKGLLYAKVFLADPTGKSNKRGLRRGEKMFLPPYLRRLKLRVKKTVASTRGTDGKSLVAVANPNKHADMIKVFMATRAWVLYNKLSL